MRLSKLELNGFKSFARKTEIVFCDGVTAIIGPNGSGKSNISDAVKWVLGEQSAKALRGSKMEDVIFNGTQSRKPMAYSEVTLTFDNTDGKLNIPFQEVAITRRVFRNGDSEYCINKNACRLKDVQELFRDTGIGKDGYSIISQGKVDEILSNKSNDRRAALEEAAGVMRYRVRKEEAERKLENTEKNLIRIEDIVEELGDRLGPLEEQSASARAYLKLRDELKDNEVNLFLYQYDRDTERLKQVKDAMEQMHGEQAVSVESETALLSECATLEEQIRLLDGALTDRQNRLMGMLANVETHVGEQKVLSERLENASAANARIQTEREDTERRLEELKTALSNLSADDAKNAAVTMLDGEIAESEERVAHLDRAVEDGEVRLEALKNSIIEAMNRVSDYRSNISRFETMTASIEDRLKALSEEEKAKAFEGERLRSEQEAASDLLKAKEAEQEQAKRHFAEAVQNRTARQSAGDTLRARMHQEEQKLTAMQSRLRVLEEMARSREGYYQSVKNVMQDTDRDAGLRNAIVGVVAELIHVPKEYEQAITMALGSSLQNIVTPTAEDAKYVIEYLRSHDYGRATLLPMNILSGGGIRQEERSYLSSPGCLGLASELVECDDRVKGVVRHLLGRTVVVDNLDSGIQLKRRSRGAFHIATLEGDIISTGGSMSGGSMQKRTLSLLGREREIKELSLNQGTLEKSVARAKEELLQLERELTQCDIQVDAFRESVHTCDMAIQSQTEQLEIIRRDVERAETQRTALEEERIQLNENLGDIMTQREEAAHAQTDLEQGNAATREDVLAAQTALAKLRQERETVSLALTEQKVRRMALTKERDALLHEQQRMQTEQKTAEERLLSLEAERQTNGALIESVNNRLVEMCRSIQGEQTEAGAEKEAQQKAEEERARLNDTLTEHRNRREELLRASRELSDRLHKLELNKNRLDMDLENVQNHIWEEYELTYENAASFRREIAVGATTSRIAEIKAEVKDLGDINLSAIEDYKAVHERYENLNTQCEDLRKAQADLQTLIVELTATMEEVFLRQFRCIQENFSKVFVELFGGGQAEMRLADPDDVLNCDIDIIAQPPGKKLQLLSLLSGGERALTAIALLFAMLKLKPPAFCILDEIESSLDEVNVTRFADYVKAYSDETQFILITHRKGSMEVCNALYGVSMEEKGISKVVSARFGENAS